MANIANTNYYSLLLIPIGILVLVFAKFGSDLSFSNRKVVVNSNDTPEIRPYVTELVLRAEIGKIGIKNDEIFIFKNMPINVNELGLLNLLKAKSEFLGPILELYKLGIVHNGFLLEEVDGKVNYKNLIGRLAYEKFIENWDFKINAGGRIDRFLKTNRIGTCSILLPPFTGKYKIVDIDRRTFDHVRYLPFVNNALILFLSLTEFIKVIN